MTAPQFSRRSVLAITGAGLTMGIVEILTGAAPAWGAEAPPPEPMATPATASGVELSGVWGRQTWGADDRFHYHHPVQVTVRGVGPGRAPRPVAFGITLDPRLVEELTVESVRLNRVLRGERLRLTGSSRTEAAYRTDWTSSIRLAPDDVLDIRFRVRTLSPPGPLPGIKHPVVSLPALGGSIGRHRPGHTEFTRDDAVWE